MKNESYLEFQQKINEYIDYETNCRQLRENTLNGIREALGKFKSFAYKNVESIADLNLSTFIKYQQYMTGERGLAGNSWNKNSSYLRGFCKYLESVGVLQNAIHQSIPLMKLKGKEVIVLEAEEMERIGKAVRGIRPYGNVSKKFRQSREKVLWSLLANIGLRCEEACKLTLEDIVPSKGDIKLKIDGKGGLKRTINCDLETTGYIKEFLEIRNSYLGKKGKSLNINLLACGKRQVERIIEKMGQDFNCTMHLEPHLLRRSSVSRCVNSLANLSLLPVVAEKYGHTVQVLLRHYFKASKENQVLIDTKMKYAA
ncbi:tyrosine-type recombinase/integrase [Fibrobacterota bacterium]